MSHSSTRFRLILLAGGILLLALMVYANRNAAERQREEWRQRSEKITKQWLDDEKQALVSGQRSGVHFYSTEGTDRLLEHFAGMPEIKQLGFELTDLTDEGTKILAELPALTKLSIYGGNPRVGDRGLATLSKSPTLETLRLLNIDVTDQGLAVLRSFPRLQELTIFREAAREKLLTDAAVRDLRVLTNLKRLNLGGGWMSKPAIAELRRALPDCEIVERDDW